MLDKEEPIQIRTVLQLVIRAAKAGTVDLAQAVVLKQKAEEELEEQRHQPTLQVILKGLIQ